MNGPSLPHENDDSEAVSESTTESRVTDSSEYPTAVLELDDVFTALAHPRRRYLLYTLVNGTGEETLSELATRVAAWEQNESPAEVTDEERDRVHISLYHSHVPKLADLDIVEFHEAEDVIVRAENTERVEAVLEFTGGEEDAGQGIHTEDTDTDE